MLHARRVGVSSLLPLAPAATLPLLGFLLFTSTGRDDAYITYWAARSLATSGEITNYNGSRLEQSSSLLQTLLLAAANRVTTMSVPSLGMWLGIIAATATVLLAARVADRIAPGAGLTAAALTAVAPFLVYWAFGGLEAPLVALLLLLVVLAGSAAARAPSTRTAVPLAAAVAGFVLVRPEAGLVLGCAAAAATGLAIAPTGGRLRARQHRWRGPLLVLAVDVVASLLLVGFREWYFGAKLPQPVSAKVGALHVGEGADYLRQWWLHWWMIPLLATAAAGVAAALRRRDWTALLVVLLLLASLGFVVLTGGDWMEAGRFLVPVAPLVAVLAAVALRRVRRVAARRAVACALVATQLAGLGWVAARWSTGRPAWADLSAGLPATDVAVATHTPWFERANRVHFRDAAFLGHLEAVVDVLAKTQSVVTVASGQAGMVPYYLFQGRPRSVRFIDRGSLTTNAFSRCSDALVQSRLGAAMTLDYWLSHTAQCGVAAPDVIYDVGSFANTGLLAHGYRLVYQQPDVPIVARTSDLEGAITSAAEFVAVRRDLLPVLSSQ